MKSPRKKAAKTKRRKYDNASRAEKSGKTKQKIVEALVSLLVKNRGGEVAIEDIAKRAGVTPRTIFRFFKDKKTLHEAMDSYLINYIRTTTEQLNASDFVGFGKNAYALFDKHEVLTSAYVLSPSGHEARRLFRKKFAQAMIDKIVQERGLALSRETTLRLALITSLVNAKIWYDLRTDFGFSGEEMRGAIGWAFGTLLDSV